MTYWKTPSPRSNAFCGMLCKTAVVSFFRCMQNGYAKLRPAPIICRPPNCVVGSITNAYRNVLIRIARNNAVSNWARQNTLNTNLLLHEIWSLKDAGSNGVRSRIFAACTAGVCWRLASALADPLLESTFSQAQSVIIKIFNSIHSTHTYTCCNKLKHIGPGAECARSRGTTKGRHVVALVLERSPPYMHILFSVLWHEVHWPCNIGIVFCLLDFSIKLTGQSSF